MKSSLKKFRSFTLGRKHGSNKDRPPVDHGLSLAEEPEELTKGMKDLEEMRQEYDGLLAVAQSTSGSAYDFARSIQEMASFMLKKFGKIGDRENENIFSLLGKVQYEISKLLDLYAAHVSQTIVKPTQNLLKELQAVEVLKGSYEEKRQAYNEVTVQKSKVKIKERGHAFDHQLLSLKDDLNNQAILLGLRFQSLKLGRELSLVTQAIRHHTAQVNLFSKSLNSLNAVEPFIAQISGEHNIDRTLSEDDVGFGSLESLGSDGNTLNNGAAEQSIPNSTKSSQTGGALNYWEMTSKSTPLSASLRSATQHTKSFSFQGGDQSPLTTYALPYPAHSKGRWNECASSSKEHEKMAQGEYAGLHSRKGIDDCAIASSTPGLLGQTGHRASEVDQRANISRQFSLTNVKSHDWDQDHILTRTRLTRSSNHSLRAYTEEPDASVCPIYSYSGPLAALKQSMFEQSESYYGNSGSSHQGEPTHQSGPISRSSGWTFASKISPCASPPHVSPPLISELHKLPTPPKAGIGTTHVTLHAMENQEASENRVSVSPSLNPAVAAVTKSRSVSASVKFSRDLHHVKFMEHPASYSSQVVQIVELP